VLLLLAVEMMMMVHDDDDGSKWFIENISNTVISLFEFLHHYSEGIRTWKLYALQGEQKLISLLHHVS